MSKNIELTPLGVYNTSQAAEILQINIQTLRKWIREGKISASKIGPKDYRLTGEDIKAFLDSTKTGKETGKEG